MFMYVSTGGGRVLLFGRVIYAMLSILIEVLIEFSAV